MSLPDGSSKSNKLVRSILSTSEEPAENLPQLSEIMHHDLKEGDRVMVVKKHSRKHGMCGVVLDPQYSGDRCTNLVRIRRDDGELVVYLPSDLELAAKMKLKNWNFLTEMFI